MEFCGRIMGAFLGGGSEWVVVVVVLIPAPVLQLPPIELKSMERSEMSEKEGRKSVCSVLRLGCRRTTRTELYFFIES